MTDPSSPMSESELQINPNPSKHLDESVEEQCPTCYSRDPRVEWHRTERGFQQIDRELLAGHARCPNGFHDYAQDGFDDEH